MGLEGMVSKRADRPYRAGRSKDWVKIKNRKLKRFSPDLNLGIPKQVVMMETCVY
jgi:bifunctional non-homologous end joining protein LigD